MKTTALVTASVLAHLLPSVAIVGIATGGETLRAFSTVVLLVSSLALGYLHGWNKTRLV